MKHYISGTLFLTILVCANNSWSQVGPTSNAALEDSIAHTSSWQLTLDVIKAKSEAIIKKNVKLTEESQSLADEYKSQQEAIRVLQQKNEDLKAQIKYRHGRSDEEMKIDELQQHIKVQKDTIKDRQKTLEKLNQEVKTIEKKIELIKLKNTAKLLENKAQKLENNVEDQFKVKEASEDDQELLDLKKKYDQEKEQEIMLERQVDQEKKSQNISFSSNQSEQRKIEELTKKADFLTRQKEDLQKRLNNDNNQANKARYQKLVMRKSELEQKIKESEVHLNQLKTSPGASLSDSKSSNKALLKQMVQIDTKNKQLHHKIADLNEDISLLRTQVKRLERKVYQRAKAVDHKK